MAVDVMNKYVLPSRMEDIAQFEDIHSAIYCAAIAVARYNGSTIRPHKEVMTPSPHEPRPPKWEQRLRRRIENLRADIARIIEVMKGNPSKKLKKKVNLIIDKRRMHSKYDRPNQRYADFLDTLKQKLAVYTARIRRYTKSKRKRDDNIRFNSNEKGFYRELRGKKKDQSTCSRTVPADEMESYWSEIWSKPVMHNEAAPWITMEKELYSSLQPMTNPILTIEELKNVIKNSHNWKGPGTDKLHNFWYKKFECTHVRLVKYINEFLHSPDRMPSFLMEGRTIMLPKKEKPTHPSDFRPITCLQTFYKILTSCLANMIIKYLDEHSILAEEQKGCRQGMMGCKEQLAIDSVILEQTYKQNRNLSCSYVDYRKAYDSIPHTWLIHVLDIYKINPILIKFLESTMEKWKTRMILPGQTSVQMSIKRGIFQGDSLSPLWFCIALNPLSHILQRAKMGYLIKSSDSSFLITHLLYMDDLKVYSSSHNKLQEAMKLVYLFTKDIQMEFGTDKCRTLNIKKKKVELHGFDMADGNIVEPMDENEVYKYLGIQQARRMRHKDMKTYLRKEFKQRLEDLLRTELNAKNLIKSINTFAVPVLSYSFGIVTWTETELNDIQRLIRTSMTANRKHHVHSSLHRTMIPRSEGGRGLIDIKKLYHTQVNLLKQYFVERRNNSALHKSICSADIGLTPLNLVQPEQSDGDQFQSTDSRISEWKSMALHGKHPQELSQPYVDKDMSNAWLTRGDLYPETEGFMMAIQDQVIRTRNYEKHIIKDPSVRDDSCRRCHSKPETVQHVTSGCQVLASADYRERHDQLAGILHQELALKHGLTQHKVPYYKYRPDSVLESDHAYLLFDRTVLTDRTIEHNRPDLVLHLKRERRAYIIDVAVPNTNGLMNTVNEKKNKYSRLKEEMERIWDLDRVEIVPIVLSATGIVPKTLVQGLSTLDVPKNLCLLMQKSVILNTARIVRQFLK